MTERGSVWASVERAAPAGSAAGVGDSGAGRGGTSESAGAAGARPVALVASVSSSARVAPLPVVAGAPATSVADGLASSDSALVLSFFVRGALRFGAGAGAATTSARGAAAVS